MDLGLLDVDWYFPGTTDSYYLPEGFYAYEWYPIKVGYDWSKVNKLSTSSSIAGVLSLCALSCPEGGPICMIGLGSGLWAITGGTVTLIGDANKVSAGDLGSIGNLTLDACSSVPTYGAACSYSGFWNGLEAGNIYIIP